MSKFEADIVAAHPVPITQTLIDHGLRQIGLRAGDVVLVHARLSAFGWIPGRAETVVRAILSVLGPEGTLMVPAFTGDLSEPSRWMNPPVPEPWWPVIRAQMPPYDPMRTRTRGVGALPEMVRTWSGARRSAHPQCSFAAIGPHAEELLRDHWLESEFGPGSPLDRLVELGGKVLFLGSDWNTATIFHLGEHYAGTWALRRDGAPVLVDGQRRWIEFNSPDYDNGNFLQCGQAFEAAHPVAQIRIGAASVRLFDARAAVTFAQAWLASQGPQR